MGLVGRCDNRFDLAEAKFKSFTRSAVRSKVLLCLMSGEKAIGELEDEMDLRSSTILHSIKDMIESCLVAKTSQGYALTSIGMIEARMLDNLVSTMVTLDQHRDFWLNHDLSGIPQDLQMNIGMLEKSEMISSDSSAPLRSCENFIGILSKSKEIYGASSIIYPSFPNAIKTAFESGARINLILTRSILNAVLRDQREFLRTLVKSENFKLYEIGSDVKVAFTVTEDLLSLGLFRLDGRYDPGNDMICKGDSAREWGMELFKVYLNLSRPVREESILHP